MITSGSAPRTSLGRDDAVLARARPSRSSGKIGSPPAISTSSSTQQMPEISGSSHSSKNTRGRRGSAPPRARMSSSPRSSRVGERLGALAGADQAADDADHLQDLGDAPLIERHDRIAAANQLGGDVRLQIGEGEDQIRLQRLDLVEPRVDERRHLRLRARLRRPHRVAGDADDAIAFAEQVQRLGRLFGQTDDAGWDTYAFGLLRSESRRTLLHGARFVCRRCVILRTCAVIVSADCAVAVLLQPLDAQRSGAPTAQAGAAAAAEDRAGAGPVPRVARHRRADRRRRTASCSPDAIRPQGVLVTIPPHTGPATLISTCTTATRIRRKTSRPAAALRATRR